MFNPILQAKKPRTVPKKRPMKKTRKRRKKVVDRGTGSELTRGTSPIE